MGAYIFYYETITCYSFDLLVSWSSPGLEPGSHFQKEMDVSLHHEDDMQHRNQTLFKYCFIIEYLCTTTLHQQAVNQIHL